MPGVTEVAGELGVSERQLQRRVCDAVGYGPKMLARVLRFRRLQAVAPPPLAEPVRFLKDRTPTAA
jgi:AraC-like DNA-binding protein